MTTELDLDSRPASYFRPQSLENHLISKIKNAVIKEQLQTLFESGHHAEVKELLTSNGISTEDVAELEATHPMFMGGNYLPDTQGAEVEIARISIESTTHDVSCVYAALRDGRIHYRVADEYDGDCSDRPAPLTT